MPKLITLLFGVLLIASCSSPKARKPISVKTGSFITASKERNKKLNAKEVDAIKAIIKNNPDKAFQNSKQGFWYYYNTKNEADTLKTAKFGDIVNYTYNVKDLSGNTIYTKADIKTKTYIMDKQEIFPGMRESLKLLKPGETGTFYYPSQIAYGYYGDENKIGTNIPLICEITINSIKESNIN